MIADQFRIKRPLYEQLSVEFTRLLGQLASSIGVAPAVIDNRTKSQESLENKCRRSDKIGKYKFLEDITDLCGVRIVLFTHRDCELVIDAIRENFVVDEKNSVVKDFTDEDRFGYQSTHLVVKLPTSRTSLFDWKHLNELKAEIQIRTVLQHAWAVLDWKLRYKTEVEVPSELRRRLFRISALLETADEAFGDLQLAAEKLRETYAADIQGGNLEIPLNRDSLEEFFKSNIVADIIKKCRARGIGISEPKDDSPSSAFENLIGALSQCGITTLGELEASLKLVQNSHIDVLNQVWSAIEGTGITFGIFSPLRMLVLIQKPVDVRLKVLNSLPVSHYRMHDAEIDVLGKA